jgi:sugar/nucleoside kinase (ribokinase family)
MSAPHVVVVGSVAYDDVETRAGKRQALLGGSATHFAVTCAQHVGVGLVGVVGEDFRPEDVALLEGRPIDLSGLVRAKGRTFRWGGRYHEDMNGRETLFTELNVFERFQPSLPEAYRSARFVFLGNIHPELQASVLEQVHSPIFVGIDTMNLWIATARHALESVLARVDAIFLNDAEATQLTGERSMRLAARAIQAMGPELVIVKRGEHGALGFDGSDVFHVPAYPLDRVVDPTGAGDSFAGGFVAQVAASEDLSPVGIRRAAVLGSLTASFCVEGFGLERTATVTRSELIRRSHDFAAMTTLPRLEL